MGKSLTKSQLELIKELWLGTRMSARKVAAQVGCGPTAVQAAVKKNGWHNPRTFKTPCVLSEEEKELVIKLWEEGKFTALQIAKSFHRKGVTKNVIIGIAHRAGMVKNGEQGRHPGIHGALDKLNAQFEARLEQINKEHPPQRQRMKRTET